VENGALVFKTEIIPSELYYTNEIERECVMELTHSLYFIVHIIINTSLSARIGEQHQS
jgi:hypothetical protein